MRKQMPYGYYYASFGSVRMPSPCVMQRGVIERQVEEW